MQMIRKKLKITHELISALSCGSCPECLAMHQWFNEGRLKEAWITNSVVTIRAIVPISKERKMIGVIGNAN